MVKNILSIICYVISGLFMYLMLVIGFFNEQPAYIKFLAMAIAFLPALVALVIGLALRRFQYCLRDTGIIIVSVSGCIVFMFFTILSASSPSELKELLEGTFCSFNDGLTSPAIFTLIVAFLLITHYIKKPRRVSQRNPA